MTGRKVLHYEILERLGQGGMGTVYKARDTKLGRLVALKFLSVHLDAPDFKERFTLEARAASALDHPNICTIYGIEETEDGQLFIAMAYYDGETLHTRNARGRLVPEEAVRIAIQIGEGLAKAHEKGIVHRDIKPANIIVTVDNVVKILDFGVAVLADVHRITQPGFIVGTLAYMSPEQARGDPVDGRTDIWALGRVLQEMVASELSTVAARPLAEADTEEYETKTPVSRPSHNLIQVMARATERDPAARYQMMREMVADLRAVLDQKPLSTPGARARVASTPDSESLAARTSTGTLRHPSIAVLAFTNLNRDEESEYFSDGLTDELITALAQLEGLRVVSRTSAFEFKGQALDVRKIGATLNVDTVLEGSVRRAGNRLRVHVELVNTIDGYQIWSQRFDREWRDIFEIQDEITQNIVGVLKVKLTTGVKEPLIKHGTENLEAYHLFLKGLYYRNKQTPEGLEKGRDYFERAIAEDPDYAPAHAGLAYYYITVGFWSLGPTTELWPKAKAAALRALEIDDTLAYAHESLGWVHIFCDWDWRRAGEEFRRSVELRPGDPDGHYALGAYMAQMARFKEAIAEMRRALDLDPLSVRINAAYAFVYYYARQYDRAIEQARNTIELDPSYFEVYVVLGLACLAKGTAGDAIEALEHACELCGDGPLSLGVLGYVVGTAGDKERAQALLGRLERISREAFVTPMAWALAYSGLPDHDRALEWLDLSAQARDALICYLNVLPCFDPLRSDSRFAALQRKIGLFTRALS